MDCQDLLDLRFDNDDSFLYFYIFVIGGND